MAPDSAAAPLGEAVEQAERVTVAARALDDAIADLRRAFQPSRFERLMSRLSAR